MAIKMHKLHSDRDTSTDSSQILGSLWNYLQVRNYSAFRCLPILLCVVVGAEKMVTDPSTQRSMHVCLVVGNSGARHGRSRSSVIRHGEVYC
jgi:hypothetical protein